MKKLILAAVAIGFAIAPALSADAIRIVGSSTVYPFTTAVAEQFAKKTGSAAPIVEATGTGGGIKLFCQGDDPNSPDAVNASREMKPDEIELCAKNGVKDIEKIAIGLDAIVLAHAKDNKDINVTLDQLYRAVAKYVLVDGKFVENPYSEWTNSKGEQVRMEILGPPPTSGTRDSFVELVVEKACKAAVKEAGITLSADDEKKYCKSIREDGVYVEAGENDNLIVQKLIANPDAFGIFGYSFLEQNLSTISGASIEGVKPDYDSIEGGQYPISRKLYVYFKGSHLESKPELKQFMDEYQSEEAIGEDGYLVDKGLLPLGN